MFDIVPSDAISEGRATDAYFQRTREALEGAGRNPHVVAEVTADQFPTGEFEVFAGLKDAAHLLEGRDVDVHALPEGTLFDGGPVLRIEGNYLDFCELETSLLGFLSPASGQATAAREVATAAEDRAALSFGARHVHPASAAALERAALVGGMDGISHVAAGEVIGREAGGTMPHALMICFGKGNQEAAWRAFDEYVPPEVPRVALVDTYSDEADEAVRAAEAVDGLESVRLDTTGSRRGDFRHIVREVRWELDARGFEDVGVFASGGITADAVRSLRDVADGFGVGSYISNADPVDFALDIVEVDGEPAAKRGKLSGTKQVYRTPDGGHEVALADRPAPADGDPLLEPVIEDGELVASFDLDDAIERCEHDADLVGFRQA
ncbi:nicotinate phosphoribosyltransferase [Halorarius halobius]|uniref:nicotinate phosphoribosyltransferase n=1 Tax=Halorarius halobius TaxID=2962671 RepID=UPI0020CBA347|nr:nicotinate phosphoribosyltransferase [Halorarius halobius]